MSLPGPDELRKKIDEYHVKASDLAREAGLSKSVVSKMLHRSDYNPPYAKVKKLWQALDKLRGENPESVGDMLERKKGKGRLVTATEDESIEDVVEDMGDVFSQVPVVRGGKLVGMVTEKSIFGKQGNALQARDVLSGDYAALDPDEPVDKARDLLRHCQAVIVVRNGEPIGILTKPDFYSPVKRGARRSQRAVA